MASSSSKRLFYPSGFVDAPWRAPAPVVQSGRMEGLRVVVTGAARGSVALATELRQRGAEVVTLDINPDGVDHQCDVSDAEQVEAVFDDIGDIDGLVNGAGAAASPSVAAASRTSSMSGSACWPST